MTRVSDVYIVFFLFLPLCQSQDALKFCYGKCELRMEVDEDDFDVACNSTCKIQKCRDGCDSWKEGITDSCQVACAEDKIILNKSWNLYCVIGCNIAINAHITKIKEEFNTPAAPYLVADTCTHDSVTVQWATAPYENISYLVQWRYNISSDWEFYDPSNMLRKDKLTIKGLHAYTNYKFRVAWILLQKITLLYSEESVVISTLPDGTPSTAPTITCLTAAGPSSVSVSWEPPAFTNGPVLAYVLYAREYPSGMIIIKDISDTSSGFHYMFNYLKPATTYIISLSSRNSAGEGPMDTKNITTPSKELFQSTYHAPYLVFSANQKVLKQGLRILDDATMLYRSQSNASITGVALHVKKENFFLSDSDGYIRHVEMHGQQKIETILKTSSHFPTAISVDWLSQKLYLAENEKICRCTMDGKFYEIVLTGLMSQLTDLHVDPYNGYLFWTTVDANFGGVYRIDLAELETGVKTLEHSQRISEEKITAFTLDYKNFRLLLPSSDENTVMSYTLDGTEVIDIRMNSQTSQFTDVKSIAIHENLFYWTDGVEMFAEEYHKVEDMFYHNAFLLRNGPFDHINIHHPHSQPDPVPLNPVENVQAAFTDKIAQIKWTKPRLLGGTGKGAWQNWLYEVQLFNQKEGNDTSRRNITRTSHVFDDLVPNTTYSIKVRAYSNSGNGPFSTEFTGRTLKSDNSTGTPYLLWSAQEGLLKSDAIGENVKVLLHTLKLNKGHVTGISWYYEKVFLSTNSSGVYVYNMTDYSLSRLSNVTNAASIAIDWFAPKIYWSNPIQQMISRANLDGSQSEPLPIVTMAKQLAIDSLEGFIYWVTSHSIECSRLNGDDHFVYMKNELFSGKHVMGLTLDLDKNHVYWIVRSHEGSFTYRSSLIKSSFFMESDIKVEMIAALLKDDRRGPMWYFSDRLFWLHEHKGAIISDMSGQNIASLHYFKLKNLKTLAIIDPALQPYPDGFDEFSLKVVPSSVLDTSIRVEGTWDDFNITWDPVESINYGSLFYEIKVDDGEEIFTSVKDDTVFQYSTLKELVPHTALSVAVKAYTYWASSRQTITTLYSPMSTPSEPLNARVFVNFKYNPFLNSTNVEALFRWHTPSAPNGIISGYEIAYWIYEDNGAESTKQTVFLLESQKLQYRASNLKSDTMYFFKVRAYTKLGYGPYSNVARANTSKESPVPLLVFAETNALKTIDVDTHEKHTITTIVRYPIAVTHLAAERKIFWLEEDGSIRSSSITGTNITLLLNPASGATCLAIDWVTKQLYWAEVKDGHSTIFTMGLALNEKPVHYILNHSAEITSLAVDPSSSYLYWVVKKESIFELMSSTYQGLHTKLLIPKLAHHHKNDIRSKNCNCSFVHSVGRTITLDFTSSKIPNILWIDKKHGYVWSADPDGCHCYVLFNATVKHHSSFETKLTSDSSNIYLYDGFTVSLNKKPKLSAIIKTGMQVDETLTSKGTDSKFHILSNDSRGIKTIQAYGESLQPFPDASCLAPLPYTEKVLNMKESQFSLTLRFPPVKRPAHCVAVSMAPILYIVHYSKENKDIVFDPQGHSCTSIITYNKQRCIFLEITHNDTLTLHGLQSYTKYSIQVATMNYYSKGHWIFGPKTVYQTAAGVPSPPTNVSCQPVTPYTIDVFWDPPAHPNGPGIKYQVQWRTVNSQSITSVRFDPEEGETENFSLSINTYSPGMIHYIVVQAYSSSRELHNDSIEKMVKTYDIPENLTLAEATSHSLEIHWVSPSDDGISFHVVEYTKKDEDNWQEHLEMQETRPYTMYMYYISHLESRSKYQFRLGLTYFPRNVTITWPTEAFVFETHGDVPNQPGEPQVKNLRKEVYRVVWEQSDHANGMQLVYELQMMTLDKEIENWVTVYNNTSAQWIVESMPANTNYEFRVRAINEYGGSNFSFSQQPFFLPPGAYSDNEGSQVGIIMAAGVGTLIFLAMFLAAIYMVHKKREHEKKMIHDSSIQNQLSTELELATLHELPSHSNFIHQTNALYNLNELPVDEELLALPQISRHQINLTKFLGRGAFGEVFEGVAHNLTDGLLPLKVAIKTLRKGATEHEKEEFLKEAKLMSNFKHDHILQLLGVCFDNNPNFIILELMEGGDLLSFLRSNRPSIFQQSVLTLDDLFGICVDVAKGCKYLEDMHFVHRDLAARNCLVSSYDRQQRIVKIGDFGLARDIYKNDYYRKEGEGLLPVRWMATESLIYGIFTSQSDIWAFGVLLWEVMTLGQQPYPARTNIEVLHYVQAGGRLDKPENCPDDLHDVMQRCWSYDADRRPSFSYCLRTLQELRRRYMFSPSHISAAQNQDYLRPSVSDGYIVANNESVPIDEKELPESDDDNISIQSDPPVRRKAEMSTIKRSASLNQPADTIKSTRSSLNIEVPNFTKQKRNGFVSPGNYNKYLELLAGNEDADGYEIPLRAIANSVPQNCLVEKKFLNQLLCGLNNKVELPVESPDTNTDIEKSNLPKPLLAPLYAQVFSAIENINECNNCNFKFQNSNDESDSQNTDLFDTRTISQPLTKHSSETPSCSGLNVDHNVHSVGSSNSVINALPYNTLLENDSDSDNDTSDRNLSGDNDKWSISTTSTIPCDSCNVTNFNSSIPENSHANEISWNYCANSSCC